MKWKIYFFIFKFYLSKKGQNISIKGKFGELKNEPSFIEIILNRCNDSIKNNTCKNNDEFNQYIQNLYFSIIFIQKKVHHENYKNPIEFEFKNDFIGIYPNILKNIRYNFIPGIYKSDNGILFSKTKEYDFYEYKEKMDLKKDEKFFNYTILQCLICSFDYIEIYKRVYLKITDVCATIGGWIDFLFVVF